MTVKLLALIGAPLLLSNAPTVEPSPFRYNFITAPKIECATSRGTGVRISVDTVITAAHVISGRGPCGVDGTAMEMTHQANGIDFAAMKGDLGGGLYATVSCEGIRAGERYLAMGYPFGETPNVEILVGTTRRHSGARVNMLGRVYPGMSGGPVINDDGAVVAITVQYNPQANASNVVELRGTYLCA